jgi:hypothetical protein
MIPPDRMSVLVKLIAADAVPVIRTSSSDITPTANLVMTDLPGDPDLKDTHGMSAMANTFFHPGNSSHRNLEQRLYALLDELLRVDFTHQNGSV